MVREKIKCLLKYINIKFSKNKNGLMFCFINPFLFTFNVWFIQFYFYNISYFLFLCKEYFRVFFMFIPDAVYFEKNARDYILGNELLSRYENLNIPMFAIENHNNIDELRSKQNVDFPKLKRNLIIGVRKTHKFVPNSQTSDFLVPYTSSRLYCYVYVFLFGLQF